MRYYKINGILEVHDHLDLDAVTDGVVNTLCPELEALFGGGIKEVDSEGNDLPNENN